MSPTLYLFAPLYPDCPVCPCPPGDEAGIPFCITIDFEALEEGPLQGTYTIRDRDTCEQQRMTEEQLMAYLTEKIDGY